jgi:hypothetical protein
MPTSELSPLVGTVSIMITLRIRGFYAAALTSLFRQYPHVCEVVQPDDEIQARVRLAWRMDSPDVTIDDQPDARAVDTLQVAGPPMPSSIAVSCSTVLNLPPRVPRLGQPWGWWES